MGGDANRRRRQEAPQAVAGPFGPERPVLVAAIFLSVAAFLCLGADRIGELGFYHDDWKFQADFQFSAPGFWAKTAALVEAQPSILQRPLDAPLFATLYWAFGRRPLGWHLALFAANVALAVLIRGVFARFRAPGPAALLGALLFLCYPTKDATMFWPCVVLAPLALAAWVGAYALHLDYVESGGRGRLALSAGLLVTSLALYDNVIALLPLWLVTPALFETGVSRRSLVSLGTAGALVGAAIVAKMKLIPWATGIEFGKPLVWSAEHAWLVYRFGAKSLASHVVASVTAQFASGAFKLAPLVALCAAAAPFALLRLPGRGEWPTKPRLALALAGAGFFLLGLLPYAASNYVPNPFTHMNRVNEVPALGFVCLLLAAGFWLSFKRALLAGCVLAAVFMTAHVGAAWAWTVSYQRQLVIRDLMLKNREDWTPGKKLLLHTPWAYVAEKAPIFIASWDITGAAQVWLNDPSRSADVVSGDMKATPEGLVKEGTLIPYDSIRVLSVRRGIILPNVGYDSFKHP